MLKLEPEEETRRRAAQMRQRQKEGLDAQLRAEGRTADALPLARTGNFGTLEAGAMTVRAGGRAGGRASGRVGGWASGRVGGWASERVGGALGGGWTGWVDGVGGRGGWTDGHVAMVCGVLLCGPPAGLVAVVCVRRCAGLPPPHPHPQMGMFVVSQCSCAHAWVGTHSIPFF
jgi:hypothetical protein